MTWPAIHEIDERADRAPKQKPRRTLSGMGHKFGGSLACRCGTTWGLHQAFPVACTAEHPRPIFEAGTLATMCRSHNVTHETIARLVGCCRETARKAIQGQARVDENTRVAVIRQAVELLRERGVENPELLEVRR